MPFLNAAQGQEDETAEAAPNATESAEGLKGSGFSLQLLYRSAIYKLDGELEQH